mmetsp:Transcript_29467/g.84340  ORF Transcript_29467/g.84340 Transcript_29467/m.84340 type:complete len:223 (-) Transcript_29467:697-1365(-)
MCRSLRPVRRASTPFSPLRPRHGTRAPLQEAAAAAVPRRSRAASAGWPRAPTWVDRCALQPPSAVWLASGLLPAECRGAQPCHQAPSGVFTRPTAPWAAVFRMLVFCLTPWKQALAGTLHPLRFQQARRGRMRPSRGRPAKALLGASVSRGWVVHSSLQLKSYAERLLTCLQEVRKQMPHSQMSNQTPLILKQLSVPFRFCARRSLWLNSQRTWRIQKGQSL